MPEAAIAAALHLNDDDEDDDDDAFEIWPENERSLTYFMLVCRQWHFGPLGGVLSFNYPGVESILRMRRIKLTAELLDDLAAMETGVLDVWGRKS